MGRPSLFTEETRGKLLEAFQLGQTVAKACEYAGITQRTYQRWMVDKRKPYREFAKECRAARTRPDIVNLAIIRRAAQQGDWQAAAWHLRHSPMLPDVSLTKVVDKSLEPLGSDRLAPSVMPLVASTRLLAALVENDPTNIALWREFRLLLTDLREVTASGGDTDLDVLLDSLRATVGDAENPES